MSYVGQRLKRREDQRLLQGQGAYVADVRRPDTLHLAVVRSPHAHARILAIDVAAARAGAGVVDVVTFDDVPELARAIPMRLAERGQMRRHLQTPLAHDKVRYVGEPVAAILADDRYRAEDALGRSPGALRAPPGARGRALGHRARSPVALRVGRYERGRHLHRRLW